MQAMKQYGSLLLLALDLDTTLSIAWPTIHPAGWWETKHVQAMKHYGSLLLALDLETTLTIAWPTIHPAGW